MPQLSWNEIRSRAIGFSKEWADATNEERDKQTFWNEFFEVFGIRRRSVAIYESSVKKMVGGYGFIDLLWPGRMIVEHNSKGASLSKAESQAFKYCVDLANQGRHDEIPRYVVLCDFARFSISDLGDEYEPGQAVRQVEFKLGELYQNIKEFAFIRGEKPVKVIPEHPANMKATQLLADLHDSLEESGYTGHALERFLVRCLFCLFAEDTGVFEPQSFTLLVEGSKEDGADLGAKLAQLWDVLNTPTERRQKTLDEDLAEFEYVNGGLFAEFLPICSFNSKMRDSLLRCAHFYWARISPAVFGSIFQGVMDSKERRQLGAHYTSERDIMKLLRSLLLDDLEGELSAVLADKSTGRTNRLRAFQSKLRSLKFLDPACGCGNFLIIAYKALRKLEQDVLIAISTNKVGHVQTTVDVRELAKVDVDQFYGIDLFEWPVRIAEVGLWLTDHQCNLELGEALGQSFRRLPLKNSPSLFVDNSLTLDWSTVAEASKDLFVLGNPPFVGKKEQTKAQKADMKHVWQKTKGSGSLDYVTAWYVKAAEYIQGTSSQVAFVSTNSITQGEQVGTLWNFLFDKYGVKINFAHRTFPWVSEARGKAHVHVVIIGFALADRSQKFIYEYEGQGGDAVKVPAKRISPYLVEGDRTVLTRREKRLSSSYPEMTKGSEVTDNGHLLLSDDEKDELLAESLVGKDLVRQFTGGKEYINGTSRWCLWLKDASPEKYRSSPTVRSRLQSVKNFRSKSPKPRTVKLAQTPHVFGEDRQPTTEYLLIPKVSSETRQYIPIGFVKPDVIVSGSALVVPGATQYDFGIISSRMHMAWMRQVCGRMKSDYQYSVSIAYNNFPWPNDVPEKKQKAVVDAVTKILDDRKKHAGSTLADLYDPLSMPSSLVKAHALLDRLVDSCYRSKAFTSDRERVEFLLDLYKRLAESNPCAAAQSEGDEED